MSDIVNIAIESVNRSKTSFCKFISANDAGTTGGHQEGFYIPKNSIPLMFDAPCTRGKNEERFVTIKWQNDFETASRFIYYGQGTRNEYRLTRFGKNFPFLKDENVGDLFILSHIENDYYEGFVLQNDEDVEEFFTAFNISSGDTNRLINKSNYIAAEDKLLTCFQSFLKSTKLDFPVSSDLAAQARMCYNNAYNYTPDAIRLDPDNRLLGWINIEFQLFKMFENDRYNIKINTPFNSVEELINFANTILNRRKSRAGKSLEHHLSEMFDLFSLKYEKQVITEDNKKPDFIFPDSSSYHNESYNSDSLVFLASKTTCKDRWRQILNEADRIKDKHLFTLQQGISSNQLTEMYKYNVKLVVPEPYIKQFPEEFRTRIFTLGNFVNFVKSKQN